MAQPAASNAILGMEGGGTRTTWALISHAGKVLKRGEAGPGNTLLLNEAALAKLFRSIRSETGIAVSAIGGAFAGCQQEVEKKRVEKALRRAWPRAAVVRVVEDTRSVLAAAFGDGPGIVVIAGTGSNVAGQTSADSPVIKAGGWGHLFADRGSAYDLARRGLERAYERYDETGLPSTLAREFLQAAGKATLEELVSVLLQDTSKTMVASWARCVFAAAARRDRDARALIMEAAEALASKVGFVAGRLRRHRKAAPFRVALTGGLFENQPGYFAKVRRAVTKLIPGTNPFLLTVPGVLGAAKLAGLSTCLVPEEKPVQPRIIAEPARLAAFAQAATEQRNPRSRGLDRQSIPELVDLFITEERHVEKALRHSRQAISSAADLIANRLMAGGRLFYIGAGTSGRLGVVDASEMPATFNAAPEQVQAIIAGGAPAVFRSQEGAEDARETGIAELRARGFSRRDVLCGIAASGQTPFVLAALEHARGLGAATILLSCNPNRSIRVVVDVEIDLPTGPELVTGSTRLKAGTATKLVLNILSTIAMIRLGRVRDNLMVNVQATNDKLRARAVRLVEALAERSFEDAQSALERSAWSVPEAIKLLEISNGQLH